MIQMTKQQFQQLQRIYNTFLLVDTRGENTIIMGQALNAFKIFLQQNAAAGLENSQDQKPQEIKE